MLRKHGWKNAAPEQIPANFIINYFPAQSSSSELPRRARCVMVKDDFAKNNLARGESWNRSTLFKACGALRSTTADRTRQMHVIMEQSE